MRAVADKATPPPARLLGAKRIRPERISAAYSWLATAKVVLVIKIESLHVQSVK